jgi:hypothetical protein
VRPTALRLGGFTLANHLRDHHHHHNQHHHHDHHHDPHLSQECSVCCTREYMRSVMPWMKSSLLAPM